MKKNEEFNKYQNYCDRYIENYRGAVHSICNLKYKTPKEIPVVFHNEYNCVHQFIINELAEDLKVSFSI